MTFDSVGPVIGPGHISQEVLDGSPSLRISPKVIDNEVASLIKSLELQPHFDKRTKFDPEKHLLYKDSDYDSFKKHTLSDLGITKTHVPAISDLAATDPFPLFTKEACDMMKWESLQKEALEKFGRLPKLAKGNTSLDFQVCGYIGLAPFTYAAWTHPKTMDIINKISGIRLKIMFDYEIAHINASLVDSRYEVGKQVGDVSDMTSVYDWHYDSNSFVIVLMLSTNDAMIGGKTGLKDGNENIITIDEPKVGYASILQGRVVRHVATKPVTNHERISSVVGYVPESVEIPDTTVLTSFKPSVLPRSIHDEYYPAWCEYRFKRMEEMLRVKRQKIKEAARFDQKDVIGFCEDLSDYLDKTFNEFELYGEREHPPKIYSVPYKEL